MLTRTTIYAHYIFNLPYIIFLFSLIVLNIIYLVTNSTNTLFIHIILVLNGVYILYKLYIYIITLILYNLYIKYKKLITHTILWEQEHNIENSY